MLCQETHFSCKDIYQLNVKGGKKIFHVSGNQKKALLISFKNRVSQKQ